MDANGYLKEVTAACGPLLYRGGVFPDAYNLNAFVCVPEANLIKRNVLSFKNTQTTGRQAIEGKEFLASTDEGFRPVNLFSGPDGAMYIVDMHRGIIQHKAYISQYLAEQLAIKKLDTLQNAGRILKVTSKEKTIFKIQDLTKATNKELLTYLSHPNGWLRDRAQQLLIEKKELSLIKELLVLCKTNNEFSTAIHALYVLEGLNALSFNNLSNIILSSKNQETIAHALGLLETFASTQNMATIKGIAAQLFAQNNEIIDLYLAMALNAWIKISEPTFLPILAEIDKKYSTERIFQEAITSSLEGKEENYLKIMNPSELLKSSLMLSFNNRQKKEMNGVFVKEYKETDTRTKGLRLYRSICGTCHGADGRGIQDLAPPLKGSEYIDGSMKRLAGIILHGISGPISVNGKLYELNNEMPALLNNTDVSDQDIVDIIRFTQNAFAKVGKGISAEDVKKQRANRPPGSGIYNEKLLFEREFEN